MHSGSGMHGAVGFEERASEVLDATLRLGVWLIGVFTLFISCSSHCGVLGRVLPLRSKNLHLSTG